MFIKNSEAINASSMDAIPDSGFAEDNGSSEEMVFLTCFLKEYPLMG
jgi:hypothetical protein